MKAQVTETVTIAQAKTALEQTAQLYFQKKPDGSYAIDRRRARPVCLMGPAGIGKTEIVRQVAEEQGLAFLSYSVTHHTRQSAIGLPKLTEREIDGRRIPVTEYTMSEIIAEVYRVMDESGKREGILFLDEFNCASETMRPIMLQLLQRKTFGPHAIPEGWMLVLAGNPAEYNASAAALDAVTADRMRLVWLKPDYRPWRDYMLRHRVHPVVLSYLDDHINQFYVFEKGADGTALVTARGWEDLSVMLRMMEGHGFAVDLPFVAQFLQSAKVAREFLAYYHQYEALIASGLAERVLGNAAPERTCAEVKALSFPQQWALVSILLLKLEKLCETGDAGTREAMDNAIRFFSEELRSAPMTEFLLNGVTNADACALWLAREGSEAYNNAAEPVFFGKGAPSNASLKKLLAS